MHADELLLELRHIVREEMTTVVERMDAPFDHVDLLFGRAFARLDRIQSIAASITAGVSP
jgi:hypothetical protein